MKSRLLVLISTLTVSFFASASSAVVIGLKDTFENGTTEGWVVNLGGTGSPPAETLPKNIDSGGPGGADDSYLLLNSLGGSGSGSRLSAINVGQWTGDYTAAGVGAISMDVNNFGATELFLRLMVADPLFGPPSNLAFSTEPIHLLPGSGWTSVVFPLLATNLTLGLGSIEAALMSATELRLYHSPALAFPSPFGTTTTIVGTLGVDNIEARAGVGAAVPESGAAAMLLGVSLVTLAAFRRVRRRS